MVSSVGDGGGNSVNCDKQQSECVRMGLERRERDEREQQQAEVGERERESDEASLN